MYPYKILPKENLIREVSPETYKKAAVIAHLYYPDNFERNYRYIRAIPAEMDVYIITSNPVLLEMAEKAAADRENIHILSRPNRGRDFGALLVTGKDIIASHAYICFVHDKKSQAGYPEEKGRIWEQFLFENTIGSADYIRNVLTTFEENEKLGILSVPMPANGYFLGGRGGYPSLANGEEADVFLQKIGVSVSAEDTHFVFTFGVTLWFRSAALKKLTDYPLTENDFPEEPFPLFGSLAHVLEKNLGFISEDAGYQNAYVITNECAEQSLAQDEEYLKQTMMILREKNIRRIVNCAYDLGLSQKIARFGSKSGCLQDFCLRRGTVCCVVEKALPYASECLSEIGKYGILDRVYSPEEIDWQYLMQSGRGLVVCTADCQEESILDEARISAIECFFFKPEGFSYWRLDSSGKEKASKCLYSRSRSGV